VVNPFPSAARLLVLLAAFACAACGLVYELGLVALRGYLLGDSVTQASVVLSVMVCAMGLGSLLAKRFTMRPTASFALVERALALVGGPSVLALYACLVWLGHYQAALVAVVSLIGLLIGAEIPLLMTLMRRIRRQEAGQAAADLFATDYAGALIGGLAFPFLPLPTLGQLTGALLTGVVTPPAGGLIALWPFREKPPRGHDCRSGCSAARWWRNRWRPGPAAAPSNGPRSGGSTGAGPGQRTGPIPADRADLRRRHGRCRFRHCSRKRRRGGRISTSVSRLAAGPPRPGSSADDAGLSGPTQGRWAPGDHPRRR
jgi:spermidine synthase